MGSDLVRWVDRADCAELPTEWWFPDLNLRILRLLGKFSTLAHAGKNGRAQRLTEYEKPIWATAQHAMAVCRACPVRRQCLEFAIEHNEEGIWGGTTRPQRTRGRAVGRPRGEWCINGHRKAGENLMIVGGQRRCRACVEVSRKASQARRWGV